MTDSDKHHLGKCLSGFSNAQGGLLIWGVKALKGEDGVDCIQDLQPFSEISAFRVAVEDKIGPYLMPKHDDVKVLPIPSIATPNSGHVVVRIG